MEQSNKKIKENLIEGLLKPLKEHSQLFYNEGWDELVETYSDDDIFNVLYMNNICNIDDAIHFFHNRFNPIGDDHVSYNA